MELLLANKADVNSLDEDGFTPLHWAATFNQSDAVKLLLANKANMNLKVQKYGWTPLRLAVIHGRCSYRLRRRSARFAERVWHTIIRRDASPASSFPDPQPHHQSTPACFGAPR